MTYIYLLIDPITNHVRYVGKTVSPSVRYRQEIYSAKKDPQGCKRNSWIKSLLDKNLKPIQFIIDEVLDEEWEFWEIHYISLFKTFGFNLTNHTNGGNGPLKTSMETRLKLSRSLKNNTNKKGYKLTDEQKLNIYISTLTRKRPLKYKIKDKPVLQFDKNDVFIKEWKSAKEAFEVLNIKNISRVCSGHRKHASEYK